MHALRCVAARSAQSRILFESKEYTAMYSTDYEALFFEGGR